MLEEQRQAADMLYEELNKNYGTTFIDAIFPDGDGKPDYNAAVMVMNLRASLWSLQNAIELELERINEAIDILEEREREEEGRP